MLVDSVGINRRIFDNGKFANDDIDHIQRYQETKRGYIADHTGPNPNTMFDFELSDGTHQLFTHAERFYELKIPLGKKPEYLQQRIDELHACTYESYQAFSESQNPSNVMSPSQALVARVLCGSA